MFTVIMIMLAGICAGLLTKGRHAALVGRTITALIWLLLFLLGFEVGCNPSVTGSIGSLGVEAFILAAAGVLGSSVSAWALYKYAKPRTHQNPHER